MAVRHWADHITTETGDEVRIEIHDANFGGTATKLKGTGSGWMRDELQRFNPRAPLEDPVQKRTVSATVWVKDSSLIDDLFSAQEGRFSLVYYKNSSQEWTGDILPDLCSYMYLEDGKLWKLTVVAKDFSSLEGSSYGLLDGRQTPISIIADILSGLDIYTHTSWIVDGTNASNDFLRQVYLDRYALRTYPRTGDESPEPITKLEALRRVLRSCGAVLRQVSGRYYIQQLTALADAENVFQTRYNSSGIFQGSSNVDLTTNVKVLASSGFNHNPGIKSVRAKYDHRTEVSGIQFPTGLVVDGYPYEDDQFFQSDGNQTISFSASRVEVLSTQNNGDMFINVVINPAGYYWSSSGWAGIPTGVAVPLTNVGPHPTLSDTYIWRGSVDIVTTPVPSDADGTLTVSVSKPLLSIQAHYMGNSFRINNDIASRNSTFIDYQITQLGDQSVRVDYGDTYFGDGPTGYSKGAFTLESDGSGLTADDWARRGESAFLNHHNNLLRETIDVQRSTRLRISGVVKSSVEWVDVPVFDGYSLFMLGGTFDGYTGVTTPEMLEINIQTAETDTFQDIPKFADEGSSGTSSSSGSSGGGIDQGTADARYFKQGSNLAEGNAALMRSNLGLAIGSDVQAWDAQLDTLSGLGASNATKITQVTEAEWDIVREIDTIVEVSNPLLATSSPTFAGITTGSIKDASGNVLEFDGSGNVSIPGNLEVLGETFYAHVTNIEVEDPLMLLAKDNSTTALDIGFIGERSGLNIGSIWDESNDEFAFIFTNDDATTAGNVSIDSYANLRVNALKAGDATLSSLATNGGIVYTDSAGKLHNSANATLDGDGNADFRGIKINHIGSLGANDTVYILLLNEDSSTGGIQGDFYISRYNNAMTANKISVVAKKVSAAGGFSNITGTILSLTQTESPLSNTSMVSVLYEGKRYLALKGYRNQNVRFVGATSYNIIAVASSEVSDEQEFTQTGSVYTGSSFEANSYKVGSSTVIDSSRNFTGVNATFSGTLGVGGVATFEDDIEFQTNIVSDNFAEAAGIYTGFELGQNEFKAEMIRANELRVKAFVAEVSAALYGEDILTKSRGVLSRDFTIPAVSGTATLYVEDLEGFPDTQVFEANDWVRLRVVDRSGGGLVVANVWGKVTNYSDLTGGEQSWTFTRQAGGSASEGEIVYTGSIAIDYGVSGDSVIVRSVIGSNTPRDTLLTWTTSPIDAGNYTIVTRTGMLDDIPNVSGSGFYGKNTYLTESLLIGSLDKSGSYFEVAGDEIKAVGLNLDVTSLPRVSDEGLVLKLKLDNSVINGKGTNGTLLGSTSYITDSPSGYGVSMPSGNNYITVSNYASASFSKSDDFTISVLFRVDSASGNYIILGKGFFNGSFGIQYVNGDVQSVTRGDNGDIDLVSKSISPNTWYNAVMVHEAGNEHRFYVDGEFVGRANISTGEIENSSHWRIHRDATSGTPNYTGCDVAMAQVWNRVLSENEIKSLYLHPSGNSGGLISADSVVATEAFFNQLTSYNATINGILTVGQEIKSATAGAYSLTDDKVSFADGILTADANSVGLANFNVTASEITAGDLAITGGSSPSVVMDGAVNINSGTSLPFSNFVGSEGAIGGISSIYRVDLTTDRISSITLPSTGLAITKIEFAQPPSARVTYPGTTDIDYFFRIRIDGRRKSDSGWELIAFTILDFGTRTYSDPMMGSEQDPAELIYYEDLDDYLIAYRNDDKYDSYQIAFLPNPGTWIVRLLGGEIINNTIMNKAGIMGAQVSALRRFRIYASNSSYVEFVAEENTSGETVLNADFFNGGEFTGREVIGAH